MLADVQPVVQEFVTTLVTGLLGVLAAFIIALVKKGFDWLSVKIGAIEKEDVRKEVSQALGILQVTVNNVVTSLQQTVGDEIKNSLINGDGKYTKDDLLSLKDTALSTVFNQLSSGTTALLEEVYPDLESVIGDMIETQVRNLKNQVVAGTGVLLATEVDSGEGPKTLLE